MNLMGAVLSSQNDGNARDERVYFFNNDPAVMKMNRIGALALGISLLSSNVVLVT